MARTKITLFGGFLIGSFFASPAFAVPSNECPQLTGYYFYVSPMGRLEGTTIAQRFHDNAPEYTFTDQAANGKPEDHHEVFLADGQSHPFLHGSYQATCDRGQLSIRLSYLIPEGDMDPASFEGSRAYSLQSRGGVTYLSVAVSGAAKILGNAHPTPVRAEYFARRI